jgi:hypothetical protein
MKEAKQLAQEYTAQMWKDWGSNSVLTFFQCHRGALPHEGALPHGVDITSQRDLTLRRGPYLTEGTLPPRVALPHGGDLTSQSGLTSQRGALADSTQCSADSGDTASASSSERRKRTCGRPVAQVRRPEPRRREQGWRQEEQGNPWQPRPGHLLQPGERGTWKKGDNMVALTENSEATKSLQKRSQGT